MNYVEDFRGAGFSVENPNCDGRVVWVREELQRVKRLEAKTEMKPRESGAFCFGVREAAFSDGEAGQSSPALQIPSPPDGGRGIGPFP